MKKVYLYRGFERFWHWTQALFILFLLLTGFEIHGTYKLFGYKTAVFLHDNTAILYVVLIVIIYFWLFFSGDWRQFFPKKNMLLKDQVIYYLNGIFKGKEHPLPKTITNKFNDLQRLTYFSIEFIILPLMVIVGLLYMNYDYLKANFGLSIDLKYIALTHVFIAFFLLAFVIGHIYLTTTGYKPLSSIKAMLTGWEEVGEEEETTALEDYLRFVFQQAEKRAAEPDYTIDTETFKSVFKKVAKDLGLSGAAVDELLTMYSFGHFKIGADGKFIEVNDVWKKIFECTEITDPVGRSYTLNLSGDDKAKVEELFNKVLQGEKVTGVRVPRYCKDGTKRYHAVSMAPVMQDGKVVAVEGFIIDVKE